MGNPAWTCAHERKKKLFNKNTKKENYQNELVWSCTVTEVRGTPQGKSETHPVSFRCFQGCVFGLLWLFSMVVILFLLAGTEFFICILYIYIFRQKLEHLRDTENETLRGNGKRQEIGVLTLPNFPFRHFCFLSTLFFPPCPGFERKPVFCFSFISSLFFCLSVSLYFGVWAGFAFLLGKCARIVM